MGLKAPKLSLILIAVVFALSCFGFTLFVWKTFGGPTPLQAHGYRFHVLFGTEASTLTTNADVRISGVNVGKVISVKRRRLSEDALLEMKSKFAPVPKDTRAIIRFKSLLGESFVELSPGTRDAPKLKENGTLARKNVVPVQQVDEVLGSFDKPTREAFKLFFQRTAKALDKRGADLNVALGHLAPSTESAADLLQILDDQSNSLKSFVRDTGTALQAIGRRQTDLQSLIRAGNQVFATTAARDRNLQQTVQSLPRFLDQTRGALADIDDVTKIAAPAFAELRPVIPLIKPALDQTRLLAPTLQDLFVGLRPTIDAGKTGFPALTRILVPAKPLFDVLDIAGSYLVPLADYLKSYRTDVITWLAKLAATAEWQAPNGQRMARLINPIDEEAVLGYTKRNKSNRHNPYTLPGEIARLANTTVRAFDCRNTDNPQQVPVQGTGAPPCIVQPPFTFRGLTGSFPHVVPLDQGSPKPATATAASNKTR
jgi:virulence factor Mce-like protein